MKTSITTVVAIVATLLFCALFSSTAIAVVPPAEAPVWSEGDSWAMGKSVDLDVEFSEQLNQLQQMLENMTGPGSLDEFQVQALASAWLKVSVTSVTGDEYVVQGEFAARFNGEATVRVTGEMPAEGTKAWDDYDYPMTARTISIDVTVDAAFVSETTIVFEKSTMAIKSIDTTNKASAVASVAVLNIPEEEYNETDYSVTYSYRNVDVDIDFDLVLSAGVSFTPALNLIEFPLSVGDSWNVSSLVSVTGSVSGFLDVKGLSSSDEEMLFESEMLEDAGITDFPIDFSKLTFEDGPQVVNGTLVPVDQYINATMECTGVELVTLPIHGEVAVYEITMDGGMGKFYYSDDIRFFTGVGSSLEGLDLPSEVTDMMSDANVTMDPVTAQEADQNIDAITSYQSDLSGETGDPNGLDLGSILPIIGLILAFVVVAALIAVIMIRKKEK